MEKEQSYGSKLFYENAKTAAQWAEQDGLFPTLNEFGERKYKIQQGLRAASAGREDITTTLLLMIAVLNNQDTMLKKHKTIKDFLWFICLVLVFIAYDVHKIVNTVTAIYNHM